MNCPKCGAAAASNAAFCEYCGHPLRSGQPQQPVQPSAAQAPDPAQQPARAEKPENVVTGLVGAIIGALIGGLSIFLLSQLGYVASISGLILAVCTLKGYELLGNKLSTKGIIICVALMLVTPYFADRISWAAKVLEAYSDWGMTFSHAFKLIPKMVQMEMFENYWSNLIILYLFVLLGGAASVWQNIKKK